MIEEVNARIESTFLGIEDHGHLTFTLILQDPHSAQGFGHYALDRYNEELARREGTARGCDAILRLLQTVGTDRWEKLTGLPVRLRRRNGAIFEIGHYLEDKWLSLGDLYAEWQRREEDN